VNHLFQRQVHKILVFKTLKFKQALSAFAHNSTFVNALIIETTYFLVFIKLHL